MTPVAIFLSGWLAGVLTVVLCLVIGLRLSGDRTDDLLDNCADEGGRGFFQHEGLSK